MRNKVVKIVSLILTLWFSFAIITACGIESGEQGITTAAATEQTTQVQTSVPVKLSMMRPDISFDASKDSILAELGKRTGTRIDIVSSGRGDYANKLNLMMASNNPPDIIAADNSNCPYLQWAKEGLMVELDQYLSKDQYPYIDTVTNSKTYKPLKVDGKRYYLPDVHHGIDFSMYIRKDFLDAEGLGIPANIDELYNVMNVFKDKDYDGNGKKDGYPFFAYQQIPSDFSLFYPIFASFGGGAGGVTVKDDRIIFIPTLPGTLDALKYLNKMFNEGLINPDFATLKDPNDAYNKYVYANKACITFASGGWVAPSVTASIPGGKAEFASMKPVSVPGRDVLLPFKGVEFWLATGISKTCENPEKALDLLEYINSKEGRELLICGIKGIDYTVLQADGMFDRNMNNFTKEYDTTKYGLTTPWALEFGTVTHGYIPVKDYTTFEEAYSNRIIYMADAEAKNQVNQRSMIEAGKAWSDVDYPLANVKIPDVANIASTIKNDVTTVYFLKIIMAKNVSDINELWTGYQEALKAKGVDKYVQAYQDYYDKNK